MRFVHPLVLSTAFAYKTDLTLVGSTTETAAGQPAGYSLESTYWVKTDDDGSDALVLRLTTMVPYDSLQDGQIVQSYLQFLYGQNADGKNQWDVGVCTSFFTSFATIGETAFEAFDSYLDLRGANVFNSSKGYSVFMTASLAPDTD